MHFFILFITDKIEAAKALWIVGDDFVEELSYTLRAMKAPTDSRIDANRRELAQQQEPYIHKQYNVDTFTNTKNFVRENALARFNNAWMKALDVNPILPKIMVIMFGEEILKMLNYQGYGISVMIGKCIYWMIDKLSQAIETRKDALRRVRQGALSNGEPHIVWVPMLNKPPGSDRFKTNREKFNDILEKGSK